MDSRIVFLLLVYSVYTGVMVVRELRIKRITDRDGTFIVLNHWRVFTLQILWALVVSLAVAGIPAAIFFAVFGELWNSILLGACLIVLYPVRDIARLAQGVGWRWRVDCHGFDNGVHRGEWTEGYDIGVLQTKPAVKIIVPACTLPMTTTAETLSTLRRELPKNIQTANRAESRES